MNLVSNRFVQAYAVIYMATLIILVVWYDFSPVVPLLVLIVIGGIFSAIAWISTRNAEKLDLPVGDAQREWKALAGLLALAIIVLTWGLGPLDPIIDSISAESPRLGALITLTKKWLFFVLIPGTVMVVYFKYGLKDFGYKPNSSQWKSHLPALIALMIAFQLMQYFLGSGATDIQERNFNGWQLSMGMPLAYVWLFFEVGIVEEFFGMS